MKRCVSCGAEKPLDAYYRDSRFLDNPPRGACKECINRRQRTPKHQKPTVPKTCSMCGVLKPPHEFLREPRHADGLRSECRECFYTHIHTYADGLKYRRANPDRVRKWNRKQGPVRLRYQRDNRDIAIAVKHRRRTRIAGNGPNDLTASQWKAIKAAYGSCCAYCGVKLQRLTVDHVVSIERGGANTAANIVPACKPCNSRKSNRDAPTHQPTLLV